MRIPSNGRAVHPKVRSSSHRWWALDDTLSSLGAEFINGANFVQLGGEPLPSLINGPTGKARQFGGTEGMTAPGGASTQAVLNGEWTLSFLFRMTNIPSSPQTLLVYSGGVTDAGAPNDNTLVQIQIETDLKLTVNWERGAGTNEGFTTTDYVVPPYLWQLVTIRKTLDTGSIYDFDVFVNGHLVETFAGETGSDGGSTAQWVLGANYLGVTLQSEVEADVSGVYLWDEPLSNSDILNDFRRIHMLPFFSRVCARVDVEDGLGAMQDMTDFHGNDWLDSVTINDAADQPVMTGDAKFVREIGQLSLANLREDSKLNLTDVTDLASYDPILQANREIEVYAARLPLGIEPVSGDWQSILKGDITEVDWSGDDQATIRFRDLGGRLIYTYIEEEYVYSDPTTPEPVEDKMQEILDDNDNAVNGTNLRPARFGAYSPVTLQYPVDPGWDVLNWTQRREPVLPSLRTLDRKSVV